MTWTIDPSHSSVGFSARYMGLTTVRGRFEKYDATFDIDPEDLINSRARVEVDMASVDTANDKRDEHLRSPDFFDVERYPKMVFESNDIERIGDDRYRVTGDLTIRDITKPATFEVEFAGEGQDPWGNRRLAGNLVGEIRRSDWDLKWNVALEAGGFLVSDKIKIEVEGQLVESKEDAQESEEAESAA